MSTMHPSTKSWFLRGGIAAGIALIVIASVAAIRRNAGNPGSAAAASAKAHSAAEARIQAIGGNLDALVAIVVNNSEDLVTRTAAAAALGQLADERAVAPLLRALQAEYERQNQQIGHGTLLIRVGQVPQVVTIFAPVAEALAPLGEKAAAAILAARADEKLYDNFAIALLVRIGPAAVPALLKELPQDGGRRDVERKNDELAVETLGRIGDSRAVPALGRLLETRSQDYGYSARHALARLGEPALVELTRVATSREADARAAAIDALVEWSRGMKYVDALLDGEFDSANQISADPRLKPDPRVLPLLRSALKDPGAEVRQTAIRGLSELRAQSESEAIAALLNDPETSVRTAAMEALGKLGGAGALAAAKAGASDKNPEIRQAALEALRALKPADAADTLVAAFADSDTSYTAREIIKEVPGAEDALLKGIEHANPAIRRGSAGALGELRSSRGKPALIAHLRDPDRSVRVASVGGLSEYDDASLAGPVGALAGDSELLVRGAVAEALGKIPGTGTIDPLIALLGDPEQQVRRQAAYAAKKHPDARMVPSLLQMLRTGENFDVDELLGAIGEPALDPLLASLKEPAAPRLRENALAAIEKIASKRSTRPLLDFLATNPPEILRPRVIDALAAGRDTAAYQVFVDSLGSGAPRNMEERYLRNTAIEALGKLKDTRAVPVLLPLIEDNGTNYSLETVLTSLGELQDDRAVPALAKLLSTSNAAAAAGALDTIKSTAAKDALLAEIRKKNLAVIATVYKSLRSSIDPALMIEALNEYGEKEMAEYLLNEGSQAESRAASKWASDHNYIILPKKR